MNRLRGFLLNGWTPAIAVDADFVPGDCGAAREQRKRDGTGLGRRDGERQRRRVGKRRLRRHRRRLCRWRRQRRSLQPLLWLLRRHLE